jgi:hypothetical protein
LRRLILRKTPPLDLAAPPVASILLDAGVVMLLVNGLDVNKLVDE